MDQHSGMPGSGDTITSTRSPGVVAAMLASIRATLESPNIITTKIAVAISAAAARWRGRRCRIAREKDARRRQDSR